MKPSCAIVFVLPRVTMKHKAILLANVRKRKTMTDLLLISKLPYAAPIWSYIFFVPSSLKWYSRYPTRAKVTGIVKRTKMMEQ